MGTQPAKQQSRNRDADERTGAESTQPRARPSNGVVHDGAATPMDSVAAVWVKLSALHPWPNNPTRDDPASVRRVADSITRFGFGAPLVVRKANGEIIAGHTRFKAAQLLKLAAVPVRYLDISEADAHALAIADNRIAELSVRHEGLLADALKAMPIADQLLVGYTGDDIDRLIGALVHDASELPGLDLADPTHHRVAFVLSTRQRDLVETALAAAKAAGATSDDNANSNGNALEAICEVYLGQGKAD